MKTKIIIITILLATMFSMVACSSNNNQKKIENTNEKTENSNKSNEKVDLDNLNNLDDITNAYNSYMTEIMAHEKIRNLDSSSINLDTVLKYAQKAKETASTNENAQDKIDIIEKLVTLNDLSYNSTDETISQVAQYIITEYENNNLQKNAEINIYITRYLDKNLLNNKNKKALYDVIFDMRQICEDSVRGINDSIDSIDSNKEQINKKLPKAKALLK